MKTSLEGSTGRRSCFLGGNQQFFPRTLSERKMEKVFFERQALLESEYEFVSELAMEYVMYSLIQARIEIADGLRIETLERISFQRD